MLYSPEWDMALAALLGLLIGSFLNVVIHRLPKMMERQWAAECASLSGSTPPTAAAYNLGVPRSACPHCGHAIRWYENLPVLSYVLLRGKCSACGASISLRYPAIELLNAVLFAACVWQWGMTPTGGAWAVFCSVLLTLAAIDWDTTLLPDDLTLPLLWGGLCAAALGWIATPLFHAFWGAVAGYMSLWLVFWAFKLVTGKDGMGYGDFKLFAALGAWFGWQALVPIILMASVVGAVVGIAMKFSSKLREGGYVPFGPFLAAAGFTALWVTPARMLAFAGL
jgi:leader peptidase (prepilin peptidase) / N-methyltransferase